MNYIPFSSLQQESTGYISPLLKKAQQISINETNPKNVRDELAKLLSMPIKKLNSILSNEQLDAVWMAWKSLSKGDSFLLADETGYGKGRVLAAISKIALKNKKKVLFLTEKSHLLSDFYRDVDVVFQGKVNNFVVSHDKAKIMDEFGKELDIKVKKGLPQKKDAWVWTTYSQFNRENKQKMSAFSQWMKTGDTLVILDESHNAASESNTSKNIDVFQKLSKGVLYSSATFAKTEKQLVGYRRLFNGTDAEWNKMMSAFSLGAEELRQAITLRWAENGSFLRREHSPIPLPTPIWVKVEEDKRVAMENLSKVWRLVYECAETLNKTTPNFPAPWFLLGGALSRCLREFSMLVKTDEVASQIRKAISQNQKPVIISDWTLTAHISKFNPSESKKSSSKKTKSQKINSSSFHNDESLNNLFKFKVELTEAPLWRVSWKKFINELFDKNIINKSSEKLTLSKKIKEIESLLDKLPNWTVSPFDELIASLKHDDISLSEVSGRNWKIEKNDNHYYLMPNSIDRQKSVADFNSGELDAILITRAGNSGISLHASEKFNDKRQRILIEWDAAPDPSVRMQFWGRVRRRNQVSEPERYSIFLDTPFERRKFSRENEKQKKIISHGAGHNLEELSWPEDISNELAKEWSLNSIESKILGYNPTINQLFYRSFILPIESQEMLIEQISRGLSLSDSWVDACHIELSNEAKILRTDWFSGAKNSLVQWAEVEFLGQPSASKEDIKNYLLSKEKVSSLDVLNAFRNNLENISKKLFTISNHRKHWITFWEKYHQQLDVGMGVEANDPTTGKRVYGIITGFDLPEKHFDASQVGMEVWLQTQQKPVTLPLPLWFSSKIAALKPLNIKAKSNWFENSVPKINTMVLIGNPEFISEWGIKQNLKGKLINFTQKNKTFWGWRMPARYSWEKALSEDLEFQNVNHAFYFLKTNPNKNIFIRFIQNKDFIISKKSDKFLIKINKICIPQLPFPVTRWLFKKRRIDNDFYEVTLTQKEFISFLYSLNNNGGIMTTSFEAKEWLKKTWKK